MSIYTRQNERTPSCQLTVIFIKHHLTHSHSHTLTFQIPTLFATSITLVVSVTRCRVLYCSKTCCHREAIRGNSLASFLWLHYAPPLWNSKKKKPVCSWVHRQKIKTFFAFHIFPSEKRMWWINVWKFFIWWRGVASHNNKKKRKGFHYTLKHSS